MIQAVQVQAAHIQLLFPLNYQPDQLIIVEESLPSIDSPPLPKSQATEVPPIKKKKEDDILPPCPGKSNQRTGDFRNEKTLRTCHRA